MSYRVRLSKTARDDLDAITAWIDQQAGRDIADRYEQRIRAKIALLVDHPRMGVAQDGIAPGLHTLSFERRLRIGYRVVEERVEIVRIFHGSRDIGQIDFD